MSHRMMTWVKVWRSERAAAGEGGSQWATIGVLGEKMKPAQSSSGQAYSAWKISDLTGKAHTAYFITKCSGQHGPAYAELFDICPDKL